MFEEHKYEELKKLGTELHIPIFEAFLKLEVFDKNGVLLTSHNQRSHSWVRNGYNFLFCNVAGKQTTDDTYAAGKLSIKDTGGTVRRGNVPSPYTTSSADDAGAGLRGAAGSALNGIVVGTGTDAESFEGYVLQTLIASGSGSGELDYSEQKTHAITYTGGTKVLKNDLIRYFNNNSGASIGVNEVGLYYSMYVDGATARYSMQARDKQGATVTIADTGQLKVTYTIQITFAG